MLGLSVSAHADSWRLAGYQDSPPATLEFIEADNIVKEGDDILFVVMSVSEGYSSGSDEGRLQARKGSCSNREYRVTREAIYIGGDLDDESEEEGPLQSPSWGSVEQQTIDIACGASKFQSGRVSDPFEYAGDYFASLNEDDGENF